MVEETRSIKELLASYRDRAAAHMEAIKACPHPTQPFVQEHITAYVLLKFMLDSGSGQDDFDQLTRASIAKSTKLDPETVKNLEETRDCTGSTSATAKKVLLFLSIQRSLDILLPAEESAYIKTLNDLGTLVWNELKKRACSD